MIGYLDRPRETAESCLNGWYITGDIAVIDDEGFIRIVDRFSRFSKIVAKWCRMSRSKRPSPPRSADRPRRRRRGRRICAANAWWRYTSVPRSPPPSSGSGSGDRLPHLWLPKRENLYPVEELPLLGSGKLTARGKTRAEQLAGVTR